MSFTVLVTAAGGGLSAQSIALMKARSRHDLRVVAVNASEAPAARAMADAFHVVPRGDAPGYAEAIGDIVARESVGLVLPLSDEEALALAAARAAIEAGGARLACADVETLRMMSDKSRSYAFLAARGLPVPRAYQCATRAELDQAIEQFLPVGEFVVKPTRSRGNRDVFVIRRDVLGVRYSYSGREKHMDYATFRFDHRATLDDLLPVLVSERLSEPAFDVDVLADRGVALRVVPRRRHNAEGMPFLGNTVVRDPRFLELGRALAAATKLSWLYDFDVMTNADGDPVVIECNPRPSGSCAAAVVAGIPLFDDLVSLARGKALAPQGPLPEVDVTPYTSLFVTQVGR